jgi:integrase
MPRGAAVIPYRGKRGVVWRVKYADADGKQVMETVGAERDGVTRKQAEAELRERLVRVERKGYRRPGPLTFGEYAETWFSEGEKRRGWKPRTVDQYRTVRARLVEHFGAMPLAAIRPRHVAEFVSAMNGERGAASISRDVSVLHAIFGTAKREELVETNPAENAERPKLPRRSWRILEPHEVPRVSKAFSDDRARRVFLTLALTGLRRFELVGLRWRHVNLVEGTLRVEESKSEEGERLIALPRTLVDELVAHFAGSSYRADEDYVFCHPERGSKLDADWYREQFLAALKIAGVNGRIRTFHDMRHTALTNLAATGASPIAVMATAGHRSMSTTKAYLHLAGVTFRDEAQALERRLLGVESSTRLSESEPTSADLNRVGKPERTQPTSF